MRLIPLVLGLALGSAAVPRTAVADDAPEANEVVGAHAIARERVDRAASALREARSKGALDEASSAPVRQAVAEAHSQILKTRRLFDAAKAARKIGEATGASVLHSLADLLRSLVGILHETPVPTTPDEGESATLAVALAELPAIQAEIEGDWNRYPKEFPSRPTKDAAAALAASTEIHRQLGVYEGDTKHGPFLQKFHRAVKAFLPRYRIERDALRFTLEEIRHLELDFPALAPPTPAPGPAAPSATPPAGTHDPALEKARATHADLVRRASGIMTSRIRMP